MATQNPYTVTLLITEAKTKRGIPGIKAEAWDKDLIFDDLLGSAVTDDDGKAVFTFDRKYFAELFLDKKPDLYFKIFYKNKLIHNTADSVTWNVSSRTKTVTVELPAEVKLPSITTLLAAAEEDADYLISGTVVQPNSERVKRMRLVAVDVDLKGAAIYRTVKTLAEISDDGFEFLGETTSDANGLYSIKFSGSQYTKAERGKADVVVYAIEGDTIVGRSHLVKAKEYSERGEVHNLFVVMTQTEGRTEYELLMSKLLPFLEESRVSLADLAKSKDQIIFAGNELEEPVLKIQLATDAEILRINTQSTIALSHELLYGIGRNQIQLNWLTLYRKKDEELKAAIARSIQANVIKTFSDAEINSFLQMLHISAVAHALDYSPNPDTPSLDKLLTHALPERNQRQAFADAVRSFKGADYKEFWSDYLPGLEEFKNKPELVSSLLLTQQVTLISGNHNPLIEELQTNRGISSVTQLLEINTAEWSEIFRKTGIPDFVEGDTEEQRSATYTQQIQSLLHAAFPTQKIAVMLKGQELPVAPRTAKGVSDFIHSTANFDFSISRVHDFENEIRKAAPENYEDVKTELKRIQRVYQVSTSPDVMNVLMENQLDSAHSIASIPRKSFVTMFSTSVGGELAAEGIHQRALFMSTRSNEHAMKIIDSSYSRSPAYVKSGDDQDELTQVLENHIPNYSELFGSPDICECKACRSVYSAAAYFVDLLRFLWRGTKNIDGYSPLDMFEKRRPDLLHLPLTCENTNTVIPYIDLVNEVMEYYTYHESLENAAYDTGDTTAEELRSNPQNFEPEAYKKLAAAVFPFSLPYHQPLDVIRTYSDQLQTGRYEVMKAMKKTYVLPDELTFANKVIEAEALRIGQEEYAVLTGKQFDGTDDKNKLNVKRPLQEYFGYTNYTDLEKMSGTGVPDGIHEFLRRSGLFYTDLVELIKTKFINPYQPVLDYLEHLFTDSKLTATEIYGRLKKIYKGDLLPSDDEDIMAVLDPIKMSSGDFVLWVKANLDNFDKVITLYQSESMCALNTTYLRTLGNVYALKDESGIDDTTWSKIHRFIRLWRKLGWSLHEVDLVLDVLEQKDITAETISKISSVSLLSKTLKLPLNQLTTLWGSIDTYGDKSLYKKLFLNKAVQRIDESFQPDKFGEYLQMSSEILNNHIPAILAAYRMSGEDLQTIFDNAIVLDTAAVGGSRKLDPAADKLNIVNLSIIYRYVTLSKALKLKVKDFCLLMNLFHANPFSNWEITADMVPDKYVNISPDATRDFCDTAFAVKKAGFKPETLQYIFKGELPAASALGINVEKTKQTARAINSAFAIIAQNYPDVPASPLTTEQIKNYLLLSFNADVVNQLMSYVESRQTFSVIADTGLTVAIPVLYKTKYSYTALSGNLTCAGIMTDLEYTAILDEQAFSVITVSNLGVTIPVPLSAKFTYDDPSGKITSKGMMTEDERFALGTLMNADKKFRASLDELFAMCENFKNALTSLFTLTNEHVNASPSYSAIVASGTGADIPEMLSAKYIFNKKSMRLTCKGVMSIAEKNILNGIGDAAFHDAANAIDAMPGDFIKNNFSGIFPPADFTTAMATLVNHPVQAEEATLDDKLQLIYNKYIPLLRRKLREDAITQLIASLIGLSEEITAVLVRGDLEVLTKNLAKEGMTGKYYDGKSWADLNLKITRTDSEVNFDWAGGTPGAPVLADNFSVRWDSYVVPPSNGDYTLVVDVKEDDEIFDLYIDDAKIFSKVGGVLSNESSPVTLNASTMYKLRLDYAETNGNAGVSLSWKTATTAETIIPSSSSLPAFEVDEFVKTVILYHRAAKFISGFKLDAKELDHFDKFAIHFGSIKFKAITAEHWNRISNYTQLRNDVPQTQATLIDVFETAEMTAPKPGIKTLIDLLNLATAWDKTVIIYLNTYFSLQVDDFRNEIALRRLSDAVKLVSKTGIPVDKLADKWSSPEITLFDKLNDTAQLVKSAVKAKYEESDWLEIAGGLSDKIRENQKLALISYLLTVQKIVDKNIQDADGLFEYFLIDVQMGACMDTSRIVQANAAVQMFVNRCLLNLESDRSSGKETGVAPSFVDADRWEWMKYYRVWEANRKIFLYPENWLEPEWRDDTSPFFKDLESELVQNDITTASVETAFRNYLTKLNDVSNLDVCGMCKENDDAGQLKFMHVFARNHNAPYTFYYRTCDYYKIWSAWEKMAVDIRGVDAGDNSGVHVIPVMWKNRLFVFWPEFIEKKESVPARNGAKEASFTDISTQTPSMQKIRKYWEVRLAWTERIDDKWSPKQLTKEFLLIEADYVSDLYKILFEAEIDKTDNSLSIKPYTWNGDLAWMSFDYFKLSDIHAIVEVIKGITFASNKYESAWRYSNNFEKHHLLAPLKYWNHTFLQTGTSHNSIFTSDVLEKEIAPKDPFFFQNVKRTYFVYPFDTHIINHVKDPGLYLPPIISIIDTSYFTQPHFVPHIDPEDFFPGLNPAYTPYEDAMNTGMFGGINGGINGGIGGNLFAKSLKTESTAPQTMSLKMAKKSSGPNVESTTAIDSFADSSAIPYIGTTKKISEFSFLENSFASVAGYSNWFVSNPVSVTGLEFHTFYHPYSSVFLTNLNKFGIKGLMEMDTTIKGDHGTTFVNNYDPNFAQGLVKEAPVKDYIHDEAYTYYKENISFDKIATNSIYNWELFFHAPLYIATRLSKNGKYEEAMKWFHYIFDPTTDALPIAGQSETSRFWKVLPFKTTPGENLEQWFKDHLEPSKSIENSVIGEWRDKPFKPHVVARSRPLSYMKNVVIKYVENLIAWGDSLFRMDTMETVNEALQLYVIANHVLGPRPQFVPKRGMEKAQTYFSLKDKWDDFSNALVELENIFPYSSKIPVSKTDSGVNLLGIGSTFYFCIPSNDKLMECWDTVADRLFKIRHCMDIEGVERKLALFAPAIDPGMLINAAAQGLSLGSILGDLSSPPPNYRFSYLLQHANDFCNEVKALGSTLLGVLEKRDGEELGRLRATHETAMLELMTAVKERQVLEAKLSRDGLLKSRETAKSKMSHYNALIGNADLVFPDAPTVAAELDSESTLPGDTLISPVLIDVDDSLVATDERGVKIIPREKADMEKAKKAMISQQTASGLEAVASGMHVIPQIGAHATPIGVGAAVGFGGQQLGPLASALAKIPQIVGAVYTYEAAQAAKMAGFIRREQEWAFQANLAAREIIQLDKQITSAEIRIQVTEKELQNHKVQIENTRQVEEFIKNKFTGQELYQWMKEQLFAVYKQCYNMAYDLAKKAEKCYRYEIGTEITNFIQYGYWDNSQQGLCSGEKLHLALRQMEKSHIEENKRELELNKSISIALLNPLALEELKATGKCTVSIPEELFDLDYQGHYFRRIKSVSLSIPCVAGPYTTVSCTLRLLKNAVRINTTMNDGNYEHANEDGILIDDDRFRNNNVPVKGIATSTGQRDTGMFEMNFRDERYLPFEGAGVISEWKIELTADTQLRQFDYSTISDVIMHVNFTAKEDAGLFRANVVTYIKGFLTNVNALTKEPLMRMFSLKHDFSSEWYKFLHPAAIAADQVFAITLKPDHFPFFTQGRNLKIEKIEVLLKSSKAGDYQLLISATNDVPEVNVSDPINAGENAKYGNMQKATIEVSSNMLVLDDIDIFAPLTLKIKHNSQGGYAALGTNPDELSDVFVVFHYHLEE